MIGRTCPQCGKLAEAKCVFCVSCGNVLGESVVKSIPLKSMATLSNRSIVPKNVAVGFPQSTAHICNVLDKSGSMTSINDRVAANLIHMIEEIKRRGLLCELGLVFVRDIPYNGKKEGLVNMGWLSLAKFKHCVATEPCIANNTSDESQADGIAAAALSLMKRAGEQSRCKFILLITNSDCHVPLDCGMDIQELVYGLRKARIKVFIIGPEDSKHYQLICRSTGGLLFDVNSLDSSHYTYVLSLLGKSISGSMTGSIGGF